MLPPPTVPKASNAPLILPVPQLPPPPPAGLWIRSKRIARTRANRERHWTAKRVSKHHPFIFIDIAGYTFNSGRLLGRELASRIVTSTSHHVHMRDLNQVQNAVLCFHRYRRIHLQF